MRGGCYRLSVRGSTHGSVRPIDFDRAKYGVPLAIDVAEVAALRGFITTAEPHALSFYELMFVTGGRGALDLDASSLEVRPGAAFVTAPGQARRWRLRSPLEAVVVFFEREFVDGFFADVPFLDALDTRAESDARLSLDEPHFDRMLTVLAGLAEEMESLRPDSPHVLRAGLYQVLVGLGRHAAPIAGNEASRSSIARAFVRAVDEHFRRRQRVLEYARALGVTPEHLSRVVHRETGTTASEIIHRRVLLEAKRMLRYTDASVATIADELSFADASHFVRSFKRAFGHTPRRFRMFHISA